MGAWTYENGDAKRKDFAVFWVKDQDASIIKSNLMIIGRGVEDMAISANPETSEKMDVLGNNNFDITGYKKSMSVDPVKISGDDEYSQLIDELDEADATLSDLYQTYLCVKKYKKDDTGNFRAWTQQGVIEMGDFAAGLEGVSTTHTVHYVGERVYGVVHPTTLKFTPDDITYEEG